MSPGTGIQRDDAMNLATDGHQDLAVVFERASIRQATMAAAGVLATAAGSSVLASDGSELQVSGDLSGSNRNILQTRIAHFTTLKAHR